MKGNNTEKGSLIKKIQLFMSSTLNKASALYMDSNRELALFRCTGLKEYSSERVVLSAVDGTLEIMGEELDLKTFSTSEITVSGKIYTLNFRGNEGDGR